MDIFTKMLSLGMEIRGHQVQIWYPRAVLSRLPIGSTGQKWLGYVDQYILFPAQIKSRITHSSQNTLFVFTDQALGPWVPMFRNKKHVIHCHDFLALQSAKGNVPEHTTGWTGKMYQGLIERGFKAGKNFICVSKSTSEQLTHLINAPKIKQQVVYNGLSSLFVPVNISVARDYIHRETKISVSNGYIVHVGGNQWYKNKFGVIEIYNAWRCICPFSLPLLLIGEAPSDELQEAVLNSKFNQDIHFLSNKTSGFIKYAYAGAEVLLFPSLAEGFGWPIAEAMACGCRVLTTNEAPMTEVGGNAAYYIDKRPLSNEKIKSWAYTAAEFLEKIVKSSALDRENRIQDGYDNVMRFNETDTLNKIERIYKNAIEQN